MKRACANLVACLIIVGSFFFMVLGLASISIIFWLTAKSLMRLL